MYKGMGVALLILSHFLDIHRIFKTWDREGGSSEPPEPSVDPPLLCITEPCRFKSTQKRTANVRITIHDVD